MSEKKAQVPTARRVLSTEEQAKIELEWLNSPEAKRLEEKRRRLNEQIEQRYGSYSRRA